jgi:hypothetical protein
MLRGPLHSEVELTLASKSDNDVYTIRVLRHRYHEFDSANARASSPGIAQEVGGKPLQRAAGLGGKLVGDLATSISREPGRRTAPLGRPEACFAGLEVTQQPPRDYLHRFVVGCWRQHPCCERATCRARACSRDSRYQPPLSYESRACEHTHTHAQMHT